MVWKTLNQASRPPETGLHIRLLGGFQCAVDGQIVEGAWYDKMRALLAYLAVQPDQDHKREAVAELLWCGVDAITARGNLRRTLSDLRRVLEPRLGVPLFSASKSTLRLVPTVHVDALEFGAGAPAARAGRDPVRQDAGGLADLYRGEFLAGFHLPDCHDFEDWLLVQREALHRCALALLEQLANGHEAAGDHDKALQFALRHVELDPWEDAAHRRVMRLHAAKGQVGAALGQYDACCRVLRKELGIGPSAQTRELAEQIRKGDFADAPPPRAMAPAPSVRQARAERRQVSVLFCELGVAGIDDPDDAFERLAEPRAHCVEIIRRLAGHLVPMPGGGLLAYFGYPQSIEDSAVRAVRAGLALARSAPAGLQIRSGVHTGLILTGGDPSLPDPLGKTSGIAIQLRRCVGFGEAAVSLETQSIVSGVFDCTALGLQSLADSTRPAEVFRVELEHDAHARLAWAARQAPLVGRQAELALLADLWAEATRGASRVLLLQGEPGVGKSRLVHAFEQRLDGQPHALRRLRCFPEYSQSPFQPLLALLESDLGFAPGDGPELKAATLARWLAKAHPEWQGDAIAALHSLYALPQPDQAPARDASPARLKALTIDTLCDMLQADTSRLPMLLVVEDLHWADASTLELLAVLVQRNRAGGLLSIFTARPGFIAPMAIPLQTLAPLDQREMEQLIGALEGELPASIVHRIVERADGVPLFAEELAKTAVRGDWADIPATLHDLLAARMDRLGEARFTAQLAATIGRQFDVGLLRELHAGTGDGLEACLDQLVDAGLVVKVDEATGQFRHALIQEAAYQSQARADQRAAHRRIAQALQSSFADRVAARPELLAQHLAAAGEVPQSIDCWVSAGQRALRGSANIEAMAHFRSGLQSLMTLPASPERDRTEFSILAGLAPALHATQGYGSREAGEVTARLSTLRERVGDSPEVFQAEWTRLRNTVASTGPRGVPQAAMKLAAQAGGDPIRVQAARYVASVACFWLGEFEASKLHAEAATALYRDEQHLEMLALFGEDLSVSFAGHRSWALCFLGFPDQARQACDRALAQARAMRHPKTLAMALLFASMLPRWLNDHLRVRTASIEAMEVTRQQGMAHWAATSEALHGWATVMQEGSQDLSTLATLASTLSDASPSYSALRWAGLAEVHMRLGRHEQALGLLARMQASEAETGCLQFAAERHRLTGLCLLASSAPDITAARASFEQALATSRGQGARLLELRAAASLSQLMLQQGQTAQARQLLASAFAGFTEGFGTPDLVAAAGQLRSAA